MPTFSVIVNTYNRALSLRETILGLRLQQHGDFEIIVVNGPSDDCTDTVLNEFAGEIHALSCPQRNLSVSRNIGLYAARGRYVAYIDDDAIPERDWLSDLEAGFASPEIAAVGGHVLDPTGVAYQYRYASANRLGNGFWRDGKNFMAGNFPQSFRFPYVQGTNMAFRKTALEEIDGFDEEFEYYLDEVDVCVRLIDRGYIVRQLERAYVHHKFLSSYIRPKVGVSLNRYPILKNKVYFAQKYARPFIDDLGIATDNTHFINGSIEEMRRHMHSERISTADFVAYIGNARRAWKDGNERGQTAGLAYANGGSGGSGETSPRQALSAAALKRTRQLCIVLLTLDYPPTHDGGIARYTEVLARGLVREGRHTVHVITRSESVTCVDFIEGVWLHRLAYEPTMLTEDERGSMPLGPATFAKSAWREIMRIQEHHPIDLIEAPLWNSQGYFVFQQTEIPTVVALQTPLALLAREDSRLGPDSPNYATEIEPLVATDRQCLQRASRVRAISHSILHTTSELYNLPALEAKAEVVYLGSAPLITTAAAQARRRKDSNTVDILFVGRLEERKGIATLLEAAVRLCDRHPSVRFLLAGDKLPRPLAGGKSFEDVFMRHHRPMVTAGKVQFLGRVDEGQLAQRYAEADIFVAPSTYESFGLVFTEAMSCGLPCVGTNIGGISEVLGDDNACYLIPPGDSDALVSALSRLASDPEERERVGAFNYERWKNLFSGDAMVRRTEAFFLRVASEHASKTTHARIDVSDAADTREAEHPAPLVESVSGAQHGS
jgi:hypothetical protein